MVASSSVSKADLEATVKKVEESSVSKIDLEAAVGQMMETMATAIATVVSQTFLQLRDDEHKVKSGVKRKERIEVVRDIVHRAVTAITGCCPLPIGRSIEVAEVQKKVEETLFPQGSLPASSQASPMPLNNKNNRNPSLSQ